MARDKVTIEIEADFKGAKVTSGVNKAKSDIDGLKTSAQRSKSDIDKLATSIDKTKRQADRLGGTHAQPRVSILDRASSSLDKISRGLRSFSGKTWRTSVKILDYATKPLRGIKNMLFSMKSLVMAIGAGLATKKFILEPINLADAYSSAKIGFSTLFGEKKGQEMMNQIDKFAKETPFKTSGVISNVQKMMAYGWDPNKIISDMKIIGDAAAATGKGDQGLESIVYALSEIKSKGKLSTQELNQLASAGIKAKRYLAEGLGFGTSDKGMAQLAKAIEKGQVGANQAVDLIIKGMKEFDGMMDKTANETVEGLKSQLEDTFEINIFRKWGQGLQDGAKRGLGSLVKLLDSSEKGLKNMGEAIYNIGKELSNLAADKLEDVINQIMDITGRVEFKNASLGGKIKILWDELIAQPFANWWDTKGQKYITDKMGSLGQGLGSTLSKGLLAILGVKDTGIIDDATSIGGAFATGFMKGFEGKKVGDALADALERGVKSLFNGSKLSNIILAGLAIKTLPTVLSGASGLLSIASKLNAGAGGFLGGASTASGTLVGTGLIGNLAKFGSVLGSGAYSAGGLALAGGGAALGIAGTTAGLVSATTDFVKAAKSEYKSDKKRNTARGVTKLTMVGAGAATGAAIGSVIPVVGTGIGALVGAGVGGLAGVLSGNKVADSITKIKKSGKELKSIDLKKHFGDISLSVEQLQNKVKSVIGADTLQRVQNYQNAVSSLDESIQNINYRKTTMDFISFQTQNGVKMTETMKQQYINAADGIAEEVQSYISKRNYAANSAVDLLFGSDKAGDSLKKGFNKHYSKYTKQINELGDKLNKALGKAIEDGKITIDEQKKIDEIVAQLTRIQTEVEKKLAQQEFEAKIEGLKFDYGVGSGKMSKDSFIALTKGLNEQMNTVVSANKDARDRLLQEISDKYNGNIYSGAGREETNQVKQRYLYETASLVLTVTDVTLQGLGDAYGEEIDKARAKMAKSLNSATSSGIADMSKSLEKNATSFIEKTYGLSESSQKAIADMVKQMQPQKEQLEQIKQGYEQLGLEVPSTISDALSKINYYEALSGNTDAMYTMWADQIKNSPSKEKILKAIEDGTIDIPEKLEQAIVDACKEKSIKPTVDVEPTANVNTDSAAQKTENDTKNALGQDQTVNKTAYVDVISNTSTGPAVNSTNTAIQNAFKPPFNTTGSVNVGLTPLTPFGTLADTFRFNLINNIRNKFSTPFSVTQQVNVSVNKTASGSIVEGSTGIPYSNAYLEKNGYTRDANGRVVKKANGGFIYDRMLSWIGEDGPEVVIPLGSNRRKRGIDLWKKAGQMMGVGNNAEGGTYGNPSAIGRLMESSGISRNNTSSVPVTAQKTDSKITIDVGGITIQVNDNGSGNLAQMIEEQQEEIKDTLCSILADALDDGFKNVPLATV